MVSRKPLVAAFLVVGFAYGIYPYVTLYRLGQAIRSGDAAKLEAMVDWPSVREGIKEDICDEVLDQPQQAQQNDKLPAFGAGFARGIASNVVDRRVTPEALVAAAREPAANDAAGAAVQVDWAFFCSPSAFQVDLTAPGQATPVRLQMELHSGAWRVTRVWLPPELLAHANSRT